MESGHYGYQRLAELCGAERAWVRQRAWAFSSCRRCWLPEGRGGGAPTAGKGAEVGPARAWRMRAWVSAEFWKTEKDMVQKNKVEK